MRNRDVVKLMHERAVADQLLRILEFDASSGRKGDPGKGEPDMVYEVDGKIIGIEVATAYYEDSDAKDAAEVGAGEKPLAPDEIRRRSGGPLRNPDQMICERIQAELDDKCGKAYKAVNETWLCVNQYALLSDAASVAECVRTLKVSPKQHFARIYLTYTAPEQEGGGYKAVRIS